MTVLSILAAAVVLVGETEMKTYPFSDPDPIPATAEKCYPYFRYDGSSADGVPAKWKTVTLENDHIKVVILPEVGGKIYSAMDKKTGNDFLYVNHVMKFRDVAMRGPWVSGGIEFNFGIIGHAPSSSTSVDWFIRQNDDGSASCFVSSSEYITRTTWQVEIRLGKDAKEFETHVTWYNASLLPSPYYHWMNAAYSVRGNPEFLFPGDVVIGHQGEIETERWPYLTKRNHKCDTFEGNAWGGPKSYHVLPGDNGFYGIWWPEKGFGSYHRSEPYEKYGRKIWLWALSREGGIWEDLLTDSDGQYTELQSGRCFNQPRLDNYKTPFKHQVFAPGSTETFTEHWGPIHERGEIEKDLAQERPSPKKRPIRSPEGFDWSSAWGEYVRGTQLLAERDDLKGADHLRAAIAKDRYFAPAYAALAGFELRRGQYQEVHALCEKALSINAYDALANYLDGFAFFIEGDQVTARERLGVAAMQPQYRSAALALVARGYLKSGNNFAALEAAQKALAANPLNEDALLATAIALRGRSEAQLAFLTQATAKLPLMHALRYEMEKAGFEKNFNRYVANELPHETYLDLGSWYEETGFADDARHFFELAGNHILAKVRLGDWEAAKGLKIAGVFPFRREELQSLEKAVAADGHWKFRYLLGVLKHYFGFRDAAAELLASCGNEPEEPIFYQYRASVCSGKAVLADLLRAKELGDNWRLGRQFIDYYEKSDDDKAMLQTTTEYIAKFPSCNPLQIAHGRALLKSREYQACMDYLKNVVLLPSEHRDSGTAIWQEAQKALGLELTWPENLGQGKPYPADLTE